MMIDGIIDSYPSSNIGSQVAQRLAIDSPISIDLSFESTLEQTIVTATVQSAEEAVNGNYRLRFALISEFFDGFFGGNSQDEWHYDHLDMSPDFDGFVFSIDANSTETYSATFPWPYVLEDVVQEWTNIKAVVYVQNDDTQEVIQSNWSYVDPPVYDYVLETWDNFHLIDPNVTATGNAKIRNRGLNYDTYDVTVDLDLPEGWTFSYTTHDGTASGNSTIEVDGQSEFISEISFTPGSGMGEEAHATMTYTSQGNSDNIQICEFHVMSSPDVFIINTSESGENSEYYTDAMESIDDDLICGVWNEVDHPVPVADLQDSNILQAVIWFGGSIGNTSTIPSGLETYLNAGGNLLVTGSELTSTLYGHSLILLLGFEGLSDYANANSVVSSSGSVLGENIDANLGGGAGNLGSPNTFDLLDNAEIALTYNGIPTRKGAISVNDGYKALTFGFPFEAISEEADRIEVLTTVLNWFDVTSGVGAEDNDVIVNTTKLLGNYPNPFNPTTTIYFYLTTKNAKLEIFNIKGQKVKDLSPEVISTVSLSGDEGSEGLYSITWDGKDNNNKPVPSGVYFYKMKADEYTSIKKMILIK